MAFIWRWVDPDDLSTVLLDMHDPASGKWLTHDLDLGQVEQDFDKRLRSVDPVIDPVRASWTMRVGSSTDFEALRAYASDLAVLLLHGGVIEYAPDEVAASRFIEVYPSPASTLYHGNQTSLVLLMNALIDTGFPVEVWRHPFFRGSSVQLATATAISNATGGGDVTVTNPGEWASEAKVAVAIPDSGSAAVQLRMARRSRGNLTEFASLWNQTVNPGSALGTSWTKAASKTITPTDPTALEGTFRVIGILSFDAQDEYDLELRWGLDATDPMPNRNKLPRIDTTDIPGGSHGLDVEVDFGLVTFDDRASSLVLQWWGRTLNGAGDISVSEVCLFPADEEYVLFASPGQRSRRFGLERILGSELAGDGEDTAEDGRILREQGQVASYSLGPLPVGQHIAKPVGHVLNKYRTRETIGQFRVLEDSSPITTRALRAKKNITRTQFHTHVRAARWLAQGGSTYDLEVEQTVATDPGKRIHIRALRHWFIPIVANGEQFVHDGIAEESILASSSGIRRYTAEAAGPFLTVEPGGNVIVMRIGDAAPDGYDDCDPREPLARAVASRTGEVTVTVVPRFPL